MPRPADGSHHLSLYAPKPPPNQVDRDTLEMLKSINMGGLPGVTVAAVAAAGGGNAERGERGGFKGGFRKS